MTDVPSDVVEPAARAMFEHHRELLAGLRMAIDTLIIAQNVLNGIRDPLGTLALKTITDTLPRIRALLGADGK